MSDTDTQDTAEADPEPELETTDDDVTDDVEEVTPEDLTVEELENQEWTLGGEKETRLTFGGMVFEVEEPDEDKILNMMAGAQGGDDGMSSSDRMYKLVDSAVITPEVTPERWRNMKTGQRLGLAFEIAEFAGLQDMIDFPADGQNLPQDN